jgi:hypothetical protein
MDVDLQEKNASRNNDLEDDIAEEQLTTLRN